MTTTDTEVQQASASFSGVMKNRRFVLIWIGQFTSTFGDWLALLAIFSLLAFHLHATPQQLSGVLIAYAIPTAIVGPLAGVFVDRWNLKRTMIGSDLLRAALLMVLVFRANIFEIYGVVLALSAVSCFFQPAQTSAMPLLVSKDELIVANSINAQSAQLSKILGPAIAGLLIGLVGEKSCFILDAASFVASGILTSLVVFDRVSRSKTSEVSSGMRVLLAEFKQGLTFIFRHQLILFSLVLVLAAIFAGGAFDALAAAYVRDILLTKAEVFGAMVSLVGVGTAVGAVLVVKFGNGYHKFYSILIGTTGIGVAVLLLAFIGTITAGLIGSAMLGVGLGYVLVPSQTILQEDTPSELLGRVSSTAFSLISATQVIAFMLSGTVANAMGIKFVYYIIAIIFLMIGVLGFIYARFRLSSLSSAVGA
ncbi:MAG: hypothetical protein DMF61_00465 [Blastocatellia bacterium AA13]|nr:MAG: hypothetical protein DMF61_00465 [Blastocatellia bacterium AA13]